MCLNHAKQGSVRRWDIVTTGTFAGQVDLFIMEKVFLGTINEDLEMSIPIVYESLDEYADIGSEMGKYFLKEYLDEPYRANKIFEFVRDGVE